MLVSGSSDNGVKFRSLAERYMGLTYVWNKLLYIEPMKKEYHFRIPSGLKWVISSIIFKVLHFEEQEQKIVGEEKSLHPIDLDENHKKFVYGTPLSDPVLGKHFRLAPRPKHKIKPVLDKSLPYIPVYTHLNLHDVKFVGRPPTPDILKKMKNYEKSDTLPII